VRLLDVAVHGIYVLHDDGTAWFYEMSPRDVVEMQTDLLVHGNSFTEVPKGKVYPAEEAPPPPESLSLSEIIGIVEANSVKAAPGEEQVFEIRYRSHDVKREG
jgi:hypothetical protein